MIQAGFSMLSIKHNSFLFSMEPIFAQVDLSNFENHKVLKRRLVLVELKSNYSIHLMGREERSLIIHFLYSSLVFLF